MLEQLGLGRLCLSLVKKMKIFNKLYLTFVIALIAAIGLLYYFSKNQLRPSEKPLPHPSPLVASQGAIDLKKQLTKTDKKIGDLTLTDTDDFRIIYLIANDEFMIFIKNNPYQENKQKAQNWFIEKGFTQTDLCLFKIGFIASKEIKPDFAAADGVPDNCPVPIIIRPTQTTPSATP